jgi:hypothetical protein
VNLPVGTTVTITNFTPTELTNAFTYTGGFQYLQWSAFAAFPSSSWVTPLGTFPGATLWFTLPGTNVNTQTRPPALNYKGEQSDVKLLISGVGSEAVNIAGFLGGAGTNNNSVLVREPTSYDSSDDTLSFFIQDTTVVNGITVGDFGESGSPLPFVVENTTPSPFAAAQRSDFYESVPYGDQDPVSGLTSTNAYFLGYFLLYPNGTETFTRAAAVAISAVTSSATVGFAPLQVVFTNSVTGGVTNWVWNFGNGTVITNTTGGNVTNTYTAGGDYTVTLTVSGPGGSSSTDALANFIAVSPAPRFSRVNLSGGKLVLSGTNAPAGVQYRILTATNLNLPLASWIPVLTNTFLINGRFSYTNTAPTNTTSFFRLVSP